MLAQGIKLDVFDQDDLTRFRIENRMVDNLIDVLPITLGQEFERARRSLWSSGQPLSLRIFANGFQQIAVSVGQDIDVLSIEAIELARETIARLELRILISQDRQSINRASSTDIFRRRV